MTISTTIRKDQKNADGTVQIVFNVSGGRGQQFRIATGESSFPDAWDTKAKAINSRFKGADLTNRRLTKKKAALLSIIESQKQFDAKYTRDRFADYLARPDDLDEILSKPDTAITQSDFHNLIELILSEHRSTWSKGYAKRFVTIRTKILEYDPEFKVTDLSLDWWKGYVNHCVDEWGNTNNTINTDAKVIRALIEVLRDKGYKFPPGLKEISHKYVEPEITAIDWSAVQKIENVDLSECRSTMEASRTAWLVGAYTGRRWGEIARMTEKNFYKSQGRWRYKSTAKGLKPVDIPLLPEAIKFLEKIKFTPPQIAQQLVNRDIKDIAMLAGLNKKVLRTKITGKEFTEELVNECLTIHVHTGRHTYAMHIVDLSSGMTHADKFVSFMLGHASYSTTWKYMNRRASAHDKMFDEILEKSVAKLKQAK